MNRYVTELESIQEIDVKIKNALDNELAPIEMVSILFYTGKLLNSKKIKIEWILFTPYIQPLIEYITSNYDLIERSVFEKHIQDEYQKDLEMSFNYFLSIIEKYVKSIYQKKIYEIKKTMDLQTIFETEEITNIFNKYYQYYFSLYPKNILQFIVAYNHMDTISDMIVTHYPLTNKNDIINLFQKLYNGSNAGNYGNEFEDYINNTYIKMNQKPKIAKNSFSEFICNILTNLLDTPYSKMSNVKETFEVIDDNIEKICEKCNQNTQFVIATNKIFEVEHNILDRSRIRVENGENLNNVYEEVCRDEIIKNNLNFSQLCENTLYEYFQSSKSILELEFTLKNVGNTLSSM
jgi:hypothetical protein